MIFEGTYLEGTIHIALFYLILGVTYGILPYVKGWWAGLFSYLNRFDVDSQKLYKGLSFSLLAVIIVLITSHFHYFYFFRGSIGELVFISLVLFWILPLGASLSAVVPLVLNQNRIKIGDVTSFSIIFGFLGLAASNVHDVIWCAYTTNLFTEFVPGWVLEPWVQFFNSPTFDYRMFGTYMFIQMIIFLLIAHGAYLSYTKNLKGKLTPLLWAWTGTILLSIGLTILDFPWILSPPWLKTTAETLFILLSIPAFYKSGSSLCEIVSKGRAKGLPQL